MPIPDAPRSPAGPAGSGGLAAAGWYSAAQLGAGMFYGFNNATLPLILGQFTGNPFLIGLLSSTRSLEGVIVQPAVGAWSDRLWTRLGRRRPFMVVGIPLSALCLVLAGHAGSLPLLVTAIVLFSLLFNVAVDPYNALLADLFPPARRSTVNGVATVVQFVGTIAILRGAAVLSDQHRLTPLIFELVAVGMVVSFALTIAALREPRRLPAFPARVGRGGWRAAAAQLGQQRMAFRYLLCLFCFNFGGNAILPYLTTFAVKVIHTDDGTAQNLFLGLVLATGLAVVPFGLLASRIGRRAVLAMGMALMALTALGGLLIQTVPQTLAVIVLAGVANAAVTAANWPLLTELIPADAVGVFAGLKTAFESVAIPASILVSGVLIEHLGYRAIFAVLTLGALAALLVLRTVRVPAAGARSVAGP